MYKLIVLIVISLITNLIITIYNYFFSGRYPSFYSEFIDSFYFILFPLLIPAVILIYFKITKTNWLNSFFFYSFGILLILNLFTLFNFYKSFQNPNLKYTNLLYPPLRIQGPITSDLNSSYKNIDSEFRFNTLHIKLKKKPEDLNIFFADVCQKLLEYQHFVENNDDIILKDNEGVFLKKSKCK